MLTKENVRGVRLELVIVSNLSSRALNFLAPLASINNAECSHYGVFNTIFNCFVSFFIA